MNSVNDSSFAGSVAVITGAGGTLCSVIAEDLASLGVKVVLIGRSEDKLKKVLDQILAQGGIARIECADVTDEAALEAIERKVSAEWGSCRFLINGAGGNNIKAMTSALNAAEELPEAGVEGKAGFFSLDIPAFESVLKTNTLGTVIPCRVFGRAMVASRRGCILNFASMNSSRPLTRVPAYAMAKAAVVNFTQWLAVYMAPAGVRVNAVAPGFFVNERSKAYLMTPDGGLSPRGENVMRHTPIGRFGEAQELLGCVRWLLDDRNAAFVTGVTIPVDGGFLASSGV